MCILGVSGIWKDKFGFPFCSSSLHWVGKVIPFKWNSIIRLLLTNMGQLLPPNKHLNARKQYNYFLIWLWIFTNQPFRVSKYHLQQLCLAVFTLHCEIDIIDQDVVNIKHVRLSRQITLEWDIRAHTRQVFIVVVNILSVGDIWKILEDPCLKMVQMEYQLVCSISIVKLSKKKHYEININKCVNKLPEIDSCFMPSSLPSINYLKLIWSKDKSNKMSPLVLVSSL